MYKIYEDITGKKYLDTPSTTFYLKDTSRGEYILNDYNDEILLRSADGKFYFIPDISKEKNVIDLGKCEIDFDNLSMKTNNNITINLINNEPIIKKDMFIQGSCVEFAVALKGKLPNYFSFGIIEGLVENEDFEPEYDDPDNKFIWEACHAVLLYKENTSFYIDVEGVQKFDKNDSVFAFSSPVSDIRLIKYTDKNDENFKELFGEFKKSSFDKANIYLKQNKKFIKNLQKRLQHFTNKNQSRKYKINNK